MGEIFEYIAEELKSPINAAHQISRIKDAIFKLDILPKRHEIYKRKKWNGIELYQMPIDNYLVFYTVDDADECVHILRVIYGGRDLPRALQ